MAPPPHAVSGKRYLRHADEPAEAIGRAAPRLHRIEPHRRRLRHPGQRRQHHPSTHPLSGPPAPHFRQGPTELHAIENTAPRPPKPRITKRTYPPTKPVASGPFFLPPTPFRRTK